MNFIGISEEITRLFFNAAAISIITIPVFGFVFFVRVAVKDVSYRMIYNIWCMVGSAIFVMLAVAVVSLFPVGSLISENNFIFTAFDTALEKDLDFNKAAVYESDSEYGRQFEFQQSKPEILESNDGLLENDADHERLENAAISVGKVRNELFNGRYGKVFCAAGLLWFAVSLILILKSIVQYILFKRYFRSAYLYEFDDDFDLSEDAGNVRIYESDRTDSPFSAGILKSEVFLPQGLNDVQIKSVLKHELTHIRRHDPLKMAAVIFLTSVFWFDPLIWVGAAVFRMDMEFSCDYIAARGMDMAERKAYANVLLDFACGCGNRERLFVFMSDKKYFERRVINIFKREVPDKKWCCISTAVFTVVFLAVLTVAGIFVFADDSARGAGGADSDIYLNHEELQKNINNCFETLTADGNVINAVFVDDEGNTAASFGDMNVYVEPGSAVSPVIAAALLENDPGCMNLLVPSEELSVDDNVNVKNWLTSIHDGADISLRNAFVEMSNTGRAYAILNADDNVVNNLAEVLGIGDISSDGEIAEYMLAYGKYEIQLTDLASAVAASLGESDVCNNENIDLDPALRRELKELFRESLSWYYDYRSESGECHYADKKDLAKLSENVMISAAFGLSSDGSEISSVCAGAAVWKDKPVYFAVQVMSDLSEGRGRIVTGDEVVYLLERVVNI